MISPNAYEEVYEILNLMDKEFVTKIPNIILNNIEMRRNSSFHSNIDKNNIFCKNNISEDALDLLCFIDYHYWMDSSKKNEISKILRKNENETEQMKKKKYNPDNLFKTSQSDSKVNIEIKKTDLIENKDNFYIKLKRFIKRIFHI